MMPDPRPATDEHYVRRPFREDWERAHELVGLRQKVIALEAERESLIARIEQDRAVVEAARAIDDWLPCPASPSGKCTWPGVQLLKAAIAQRDGKET